MTTLDALLERNRRNDLASGGPGANNHVPMTLIALHRMGADPDRMRRYAENFAATPVKTAPESITVENWRDRLGDVPFAAYAAFFDAWIARAPVDAVLRESLATLMNGQAGSAFHPLLRLGYALDYDNPPEIAASLAYWAATYQPNPDFDASAPPVDPALLLADSADFTTPLNITLDNSIVSRMSQVYASPLFRAALRPVRFPDAEPLSQMSELVMDAFTRTHDFTILHALTSCQALRSILPYLDDRRSALSRFWHAVCAAHVTVLKARPVVGKDSVNPDPPDWDELLPRATAASASTISAYEHVVKLVYSCWLESRHYGRDRYRDVAEREIDSPCRFV